MNIFSEGASWSVGLKRKLINPILNLEPLVSIIIPTYNRAHLIGETLDSVLAQTYTNWECIIVDDGSTDATAEVVQTYLDKDPRFQYHHRPADRLKGANACRNYGFEMSKGEYIQWLDSDDLISENKIEEQTKVLLNHIDSIAICKWKKFYNNRNKESLERDYLFFKGYKNPTDIFQDFGESKSFLPSHSYLVSRDILSKSGLWDDKLKINQDGEFFTRIILNSKSIHFTQLPCVYYRIQIEESVSDFNNQQKALEAIESWKKIQEHLNKSKIIDSPYINNGKKYLYSKLKFRYSNLIKKNKGFFKEQIMNDSLLNRLILKFI
ncbi:MAG: glycosyltransferase [Flavobacteriaceae bacterium]|nr:glycosyltransferase [Flavobacteriaceae bacterium]